MSHTLSSPERPKIGSTKIKYTGKAKRKKSVLNVTHVSSGEESDTCQSVAMNDPLEASLSDLRPKICEVLLQRPSPSPPCSQRNSQESQVVSTKPASKAAGPPSRSSSVISPNHLTHRKSPSVRSVRAKSSEKTSPASKTHCPDTPDNDADETSSIAESSVGSRIRRSEPERIQYFKDQSQCDDMELRRAHCIRCNKWINLGKKQTYAVRPWEIHRRKCDRQPPVSKEVDEEPEVEKPEEAISVSDSGVEITRQPSSQSAPVEAEMDKPEGDVSVSESSLDTTKQPSPQSDRGTDAERKALLEADPRAQEVRPHEVLCRSCQKWVKLSIGRPYILGNWHIHQQRCCGVVPSRVATTERKIQLLNDPQAKTSSAQNVECAFCRTIVELDGVAEYDLTKWHEHKAKCSFPGVQPPLKAPVSRRSRVFPSLSDQTISQTHISKVHKPATSWSLASIDATATNDSALPRVGEKRPRDEEEEEVVKDRPINRPRTEAYHAPMTEAPGPWGWFMQPLKAFVRGFREGLGSPST